MSYDCRLCGVGKWYCQCHLEDEEVETEEEVQDEGLQTPMKKSSLPSMSPEDVTTKSTGFMKRKGSIQRKIIVLPIFHPLLTILFINNERGRPQETPHEDLMRNVSWLRWSSLVQVIQTSEWRESSIAKREGSRLESIPALACKFRTQSML